MSPQGSAGTGRSDNRYFGTMAPKNLSGVDRVIDSRDPH